MLKIHGNVINIVLETNDWQYFNRLSWRNKTILSFSTIDQDNDLLYISYGQLTQMFTIFNLNTNKWTVHLKAEIVWCDINEDDDYKLKWDKFPISLWIKGYPRSLQIVFDTILIAMVSNDDFGQTALRILDLDDEIYQWMQPNIDISSDVLGKFYSIIVDQHNYLYFGSQWIQTLSKDLCNEIIAKYNLW